MSVKRELMVEYDDPLALQAHTTVGRLVDSNQADDRRMIRLVRERPLLYARNNMPVASYYTQVKLLWQEVADEMGWSVADVRRKWSHVRNSYSRHLRNEIHGVRTGKGRMVSRWYLADELQFLKEHMATDMRSSPYSSWMETPEKVASSEHVEVKPFMANPWFTLATQTKSEPEHNDDSSSSHTFEPDENSAYFQFFRGIHNDYQELPAKRQRLFRRQCLQLLHNLLDEEEPARTDSQSDAINLSSSGQPAEGSEQNTYIVDTTNNVTNILPN